MSKIINPNESPIAKLSARLSVNEAALESVLNQLENIGKALNTITYVLDEHLKESGGIKSALEAIVARRAATQSDSVTEDAPPAPKEPTDIGVA